MSPTHCHQHCQHIANTNNVKIPKQKHPNMLLINNFSQIKNSNQYFPGSHRNLLCQGEELRLPKIISHICTKSLLCRQSVLVVGKSSCATNHSNGTLSEPLPLTISTSPVFHHLQIGDSNVDGQNNVCNFNLDQISRECQNLKNMG